MNRVNHCISAARNTSLLLLLIVITIILMGITEVKKQNELQTIREALAEHMVLSAISKKLGFIIKLNSPFVDPRMRAVNEALILPSDPILEDQSLYKSNYYPRIGVIDINFMNDSPLSKGLIVSAARPQESLWDYDPELVKFLGPPLEFYSHQNIPDFSSWTSVVFTGDETIALIARATISQNHFRQLEKHLSEIKHTIINRSWNDKEVTQRPLYAYLLGKYSSDKIPPETPSEIKQESLTGLKYVRNYIDEVDKFKKTKLINLYRSKEITDVTEDNIYEKYKLLENKYLSSEVTVPILAIKTDTYTALGIIAIIYSILSIVLSEKSKVISKGLNESPTSTWIAIDAHGNLGRGLGGLWRLFILFSPLSIAGIILLHLINIDSITIQLIATQIGLVFLLVISIVANFKTLQHLNIARTYFRWKNGHCNYFGDSIKRLRVFFTDGRTIAKKEDN